MESSMKVQLASNPSQGQIMADALKGWVMIVLSLIFVSLYGAAIIGWLRPLADEKMVIRLEPIIFVIIGYYFGRLPAQQNEKSLKDEIIRQTQKADAAQHAKEQAQQTKEAFEEKIKNAMLALGATASQSSESSLSPSRANGTTNEALRQSAVTALKILNS
jgi:hypothetical protein